MIDFKKTVENTIIPGIKRMIEKEIEHINYMENVKIKNNTINGFIQKSNDRLKQLNISLNEYEKFLIT